MPATRVRCHCEVRFHIEPEMILGILGSVNITIKVTDVNDCEPTFAQPEYRSSIAETAPIGSPVMSVSAQDDDDEAE